MDEARVEFRGDEGTPIRYEDIVLGRDVVFLVWDHPYDEEVQAIGAPAVGTFNYTACCTCAAVVRGSGCA
jgi:hypothetical protein